MKKLAFFFIILTSLALITGCGNSRKNIVRFTPEGSETITRETPKTIFAKTEDVEEVKPKVTPFPTIEEIEKKTVEKEKETDVEFNITSLVENVLKSDKGYHLIQGTTPKSTDKIVVNDYELSKYKSGQTEWTYIAAASLGTLKKGENNFTIKALDSKGNKIASKTVTIVYDGISSGTSGALAATGSNLNFVLIISILGILSAYGLRRQFQA